MEQRFAARGRKLEELTLEEMDAEWERIKLDE
jgi:hypothetical protein